MLGSMTLAFLLVAPGTWHYDDEAVEAQNLRPVPAKAAAQTSAPRPVVAPIPIPPLKPEPKPVPVERRPTAVPEQPDANVRALIEKVKAETPKAPIAAPRRSVPVERTCDKAVARLAPRWRLADSTGKVWVARNRDALITHVRAVNAVLLSPEPIAEVPVFSFPVVEMPPTTVISSPIITTPVVSSTYTTLEAAPTTTLFSAPTYSVPLMSSPVYTGMGGGCAGGMCR